MTTPLSDIVAAMAPGYLSRLIQQQETLQRLAARVRRQEFDCLNALFEATQRIALDAPIFGYNEAGEAAAELHEVIASFRASPTREDVARLDCMLGAFDDAVNHARMPASRSLGQRRHTTATMQHAQVA